MKFQWSATGLQLHVWKKNTIKKKSKALDLEQNADKDSHSCLSALILDTSLFIFLHFWAEIQSLRADWTKNLFNIIFVTK